MSGSCGEIASPILPRLEDGRPVVRDPNHNSPARPERPAYDLINKTQLKRMLDSWPYGYTYVIAPKSKVVD